MPEPASDSFARLCRNLFEEEPTSFEAPRESSFGRFRLLSELGRGGVGVVWRAQDPLLDREVALKILPPSTSREDYERILREARVPSRLSHPGIVRVHEVGESEGRPFLVMDLVPGIPLSKLGPTPLRRKVEIVAELALTLEFAHSQGVIHRDLKPSNVLIADAGRPVLVDFGLARTIGRDERVTQTGAVFGTPVYMSPEQAGGSPADVDARSDLYSLGVILYELVAGRPPFKADSPYDVLQKILTASPARIPDAPRELEAVIFKALAKRKEDRYASAGEFAHDLKAWLDGGTVQAPTVRIRTKRKWALPTLGVGAVLLGSLSVAVAIELREPLRAVVDFPRPALPPGDARSGWRRAVRAALDGEPVRDLEIRRVREGASRAMQRDPREFTPHVTLSRLELVAGNEAGAMEAMENAIRMGVPEREPREVQCGIILATSHHLRFTDHPFRIEFSSIQEDPRFPPVLKRLKEFPLTHFGRALELLLAGRSADAAGVVSGAREQPNLPELRLLLAIANYNCRKLPASLPHLAGLLEELPGPVVGALIVLMQLPGGKVQESLFTLDRVARIPGSDWETLYYLRGLCLMEAQRYEDAEKSLLRVGSERVRRYSLGLLELDRGNRAKAAEHLRACGGYYPAQYHLACATTESGKSAVDLIDKAIKAAWSEGEFHPAEKPEGQKPRARIAHRAIPFFTLGREIILRDPLLQPLRDNPETDRRLRALLEP